MKLWDQQMADYRARVRALTPDIAALADENEDAVHRAMREEYERDAAQAPDEDEDATDMG